MTRARLPVMAAQFLRSTAATTMAVGLAGQGLLFVTSVITARLLGPEDRGLLALAALGPTALTMVATLGVPVGVTYYLARTEDPAQAKRYRAAAVSLAAALGLFLSLLYAVALVLAEPLLPNGGRTALWLSLGAVGPLVVVTILTAIAQAVPGLRIFNALRLLPVLGYALLLAVLAMRGGASLEAVTAVWVIAQIVASAVGIIVLAWRWFPQAWGVTRERRDIVRYGLASYVGALGHSDAQRLLEQVIVFALLSATDLGFWVVATSLTLVLSLPARNIRMIAFPDIARTSNHNEAHRKARRYFFMTAGSTGVLTVCLVLTSSWLIRVVYGADYAGAIEPSRWLLIAAWFLAMRRSLGDSLRSMGITAPGSLVEGCHLILLAVLVSLLAAWRGIEGAALAVIISTLISSALQAGLWSQWSERTSSSEVI